MRHIIALLVSIPAALAAQQAEIHTFGGEHFEEGRQIITCADGGFLAVGTTGSYAPGNTDIYLLRLAADLTCLWNKSVGGMQTEWGYSVVEDSFGTFYVCGFTNSSGEGGYDAAVYRIDASGDIIWHHTYGGNDWDFAYDICAHPDGGFVIAGNTYSIGNQGSVAWLTHIGPLGNVIGEATLNETGENRWVDVEPYPDGIVAAGYAQQNESISSIICAYTTDLDMAWSFQLAPEVQVNAITVVDDNIFYCGNWHTNDLEIGVFGILHTDGSPIAYFGEPNTFTYHSNAIDVVGNKVVMPGGITFFGAGGFDANLLFKNLNNGFFGNPTFGQSLDEELYGGCPDGNGGYIAVGVSESLNENAEPQLLVIKVDAISSGDYTDNFAIGETCLITGLTEYENSLPGILLAETWFDLTGRELIPGHANMACGVYIRVSRYTNGTVTRSTVVIE